MTKKWRFKFLMLILFYALASVFFFYILQLDIENILLILASSVIIAFISQHFLTRWIGGIWALIIFLYIIFLKIPTFPFQVVAPNLNQIFVSSYGNISDAKIFINSQVFNFGDFSNTSFDKIENISFASSDSGDAKIIISTLSGNILLYPQSGLEKNSSGWNMNIGKIVSSGENILVDGKNISGKTIFFKPGLELEKEISESDKNLISDTRNNIKQNILTDYQKKYFWIYADKSYLMQIINFKMKYGKFLDPKIGESEKNFQIYQQNINKILSY